MLGIPLSAPGGDLSKWFIPTYVGHTKKTFPWGLPSTVHPHIRGAYLTTCTLALSPNGSSPHTWGILWGGATTPTRLRFIPTYVGHTPNFCLRLPVEIRFIPTYVGHTYTSASRSAAARGSSPPTWGIQLRVGLAQDQPRFIPTYVGHTASSSGTENTISVHPHIRGAYLTTCTLALSPNGSSPHTWGILWGGATTPTRLRFIPTYVGHTLPGHRSRH